MRACMRPLICSTTIIDLTRMSVVEAIVTFVFCNMKSKSRDNVCLVDLRLLEVAVRLAKLGVAKIVVVTGCTATLDDYWHMLLESQMSFIPYSEHTIHEYTYISSATMELSRSPDLNNAIWVGTVARPIDFDERCTMSYGLATLDGRQTTMSVPRSIGSQPETLGTTLRTRSQSYSIRGSYVRACVCVCGARVCVPFCTHVHIPCTIPQEGID